MHCYVNVVDVVVEDADLPHQLHDRLVAWRNKQRGQDLNHSSKAMLQLLLSHGAHVDLLYPGGYDMLEAASMGYATGLMEVLLGVEPFRSMMEGTWSSSSSSSHPDAGQPAPADTSIAGTVPMCAASSSSIAHDAPEASSSGLHKSSSAGGAPEAIFSVVPLDRCSQPLSWSARDCNGGTLHILQLGWQPVVQPGDAGTALLTSCKEVRAAS
jgi:hypothetical protein